MSEIVAIVEGETEQTFVHDQLAAHLGLFGIAIWAVLPGKSRNRGGIKKWESAKNDILRTLKEGRYCTTMFDFYAMPADWPGRQNAAALPWEQRGVHVEQELLKAIATEIGQSFNPAQLIPYVQLHEFEALMFAGTKELADLSAAMCGLPVNYLMKQFDNIITASGHPEAIDDGYETCPSRRIMSLVRGYRKRVHSPIVSKRIGLPVLRAKCAHFGNWIQKLELLGAEKLTNTSAKPSDEVGDAHINAPDASG